MYGKFSKYMKENKVGKDKILIWGFGICMNQEIRKCYSDIRR